MTTPVEDQNCANCFFSRTLTRQQPVSGSSGATLAVPLLACCVLAPATVNSSGSATIPWQAVDSAFWCGYWSDDGTLVGGPAGPQGETGSDGPQGNTGPKGDTGPAGPGFSAPPVGFNQLYNFFAFDFTASLGTVLDTAGLTATQAKSGLLTTDLVYVSCIGALPTGVAIGDARVSVADTLSIRFVTSNGDQALGSLAYRVLVVR